MRNFIRIPVATAICALALTACSVSAGSSDSVGTEELEKKVDSALTEQVGQSPEKVDCPDELKAKKGATTRCTLTTKDGLRYGLTVTAGSPKDGNVPLDFKVDDKPK